MSEAVLKVEEARALARSLTAVAHAKGLPGVEAVVEEWGLRSEAREVEGRWCWVEVPNHQVVFRGGKFGPHTLGLAVSSRERIEAHFAGYVEAQSREHLGCPVPSPAPPAAKRLPRIGDKVTFQRGMYGSWRGTVRDVYVTRAGRVHWKNGGEVGLVVSYAKRKGGSGRYRVLARNVVLAESGAHYDLKEAP